MFRYLIIVSPPDCFVHRNDARRTPLPTTMASAVIAPARYEAGSNPE
jgi:hypothetical protein